MLYGGVQEAPSIVSLSGSDSPFPVVDSAFSRRRKLIRARRGLPPAPFPDSLSDAVTGQLLLRYAVQDVHVPAQGSVKFGLYRAHVCSSASAVVGDLDLRRLA